MELCNLTDTPAGFFAYDCTLYSHLFSVDIVDRNMGSPQADTWMSLLEENLLGEEDVHPSDALFWYSHAAACSVENDSSRGHSDDQDKHHSKKRSRDESWSGAGASKACREKMRRDRLTDRFLELSAVLEPGKNPKTDKATILAEAVKAVTQLRTEVRRLKDANHQLKEAVKELKAEKTELRDEKFRLKAEKERLEQQMKSVILPESYMPHPVALHVTVAALAAQTQVSGNKPASVSRIPGMTMWQYLPSAAVDTSQDHVLRAPVA